MRAILRGLGLSALAVSGVLLGLHVVLIDAPICFGLLYACYPNTDGPGLRCATVSYPELILKSAFAAGGIVLFFKLWRGGQ